MLGDVCHLLPILEFDGLNEAIEPYATGKSAVNFLTDDEDNECVKAIYGENYDWLVEIKRVIRRELLSDEPEYQTRHLKIRRFVYSRLH